MFVHGTEVPAGSGSDELVLDPEFNAFKIVATGLGTLIAVDNSAQGAWTMADSDTIPHNLGYLPAYLLYVSVYSDTYRMLDSIWLNPDGTRAFPGLTLVSSYVDATKLVVRLYVAPNANPPNKTIYYRYYLLREISS